MVSQKSEESPGGKSRLMRVDPMVLTLPGLDPYVLPPTDSQRPSVAWKPNSSCGSSVLWMGLVSIPHLVYMVYPSIQIGKLRINGKSPQRVHSADCTRGLYSSRF